jgi:hypothetical protein
MIERILAWALKGYSVVQPAEEKRRLQGLASELDRLAGNQPGRASSA